jgi:predicted secreted protein
MAHGANFDLILQWDENTEPDLATGSNPRYKIYYKTGSSGNGIKTNYIGLPVGEAAGDEGPSAVGVTVEQDENPEPGIVQFTLHNLDDTQSYNIAVSALDNVGNESDLSNEVSTIATPDTPPTISISNPTTNSTYLTTSATLTIDGAASDDRGISGITWANSTGGSGTASYNTGTWSVSGISLREGANVITVTARDAANQTATDTLTVTYNAPDLAPSVAITSPTTSSTHTTTSASINLGGTASDDKTVSSVTWANSTGGSGTATYSAGTWSVASISLREGANVITVTARDAANQTATDTLTVTYNAPDLAPTLSITIPTSNESYTSVFSSVDVGGTASDEKALSEVKWTNSRGGSGTAVVTNGTWMISNIRLASGDTLLTVTATDTGGQSTTKTLMITYRIAPPKNLVILTPQ